MKKTEMNRTLIQMQPTSLRQSNLSDSMTDEASSI